MEVAREEVFGPVLAVVRAETVEEAIDPINEHHYGNGVSIFTASGRRPAGSATTSRSG